MQYSDEPMLEMFVFETTQLIEQLETSILSSEKSSCYTESDINEIFRIMHTIKGSAAMMMFEDISALAHSIEDLFYFLREEKPTNIDYSTLSDLILEGVDFIKVEIEKIKNGDVADGAASTLIDKIKTYLAALKEDNLSSMDPGVNEQKDINKQQFSISKERTEDFTLKKVFKAVMYFEDDCQMENIRAYSVVHNLKGITDEVFYIPEDILDNDDSVEMIRREGFKIYLKADCTYEQLNELLLQTLYLKDLKLVELEDDTEIRRFFDKKQAIPSRASNMESQKNRSIESGGIQTHSNQQSIISVSVSKLDRLMDLIGEMVIAEAMVLQNPDLKGMELDNFQKAARQLHKITGEIQDMVMSIRMVPLSATFHKMHRIVRDMCKKLGKEVELEIIGEETEIDKSIIEHISDPLMHLVRNAIDHGIEAPEEREAKGKPPIGTVTLEAKNSGNDVLIIVRDDGRGLSKEKILLKARKNGLLRKREEDMTDKEIFNLIFLPGFSTKESVTEFSGRGVGMDVVVKNIDAIGGSVSVDSIPDKGTAFTLKIPLTLAIIDGMNIKVGNSYFTIPIISIKESFKPKEGDIVIDPDGNEMILVRGRCYPILRLHEIYKVKNSITEFANGIMILVEQDEKILCLFADELLGQQQVVIKSLPNYIRRYRRIEGIAGCTLLGDGSISLILDIAGLASS